MARFVFLLLFPFLLFSYSWKDKLYQATPGEYIVFEQNKILTLLTVSKNSENYITLEEISFKKPQEKISSWNTFIQNKCKEALSWTSLVINKKETKILECTSYTQQENTTLLEQKNLFIQLLNLPLQTTHLEDRKKIGPRPLDGEKDRRSFWLPEVVKEGVKLEPKPEMDIVEAFWPKDHSELEGKKIHFYFAKNGFSLPYFIQIDTTHLKLTLPAVDSGEHLILPRPIILKK
jgi:hypothetical protein